MQGLRTLTTILIGAGAMIATSQTVLAQAPANPAPRICSSKPQEAGTTGGTAAPWLINVSNEGFGCTHVRRFPSGTNGYQVMQAPQHGQLTQQTAGVQTYVTYAPVKGYVGADTFTLRSSGQSVILQYNVLVVH